jgi:hypothetical protein
LALRKISRSSAKNRAMPCQNSGPCTEEEFTTSWDTNDEEKKKTSLKWFQHPHSCCLAFLASYNVTVFIISSFSLTNNQQAALRFTTNSTDKLLVVVTIMLSNVFDGDQNDESRISQIWKLHCIRGSSTAPELLKRADGNFTEL